MKNEDDDDDVDDEEDGTTSALAALPLIEITFILTTQGRGRSPRRHYCC